MRFLVDHNLSHRLAAALTQAGHDAVHLSAYDMQRASDEQVMARAAAEDRVVLSADADFGALLAQSRAATPSVLFIRRLAGRRVTEQAALILGNLDTFADDLAAGALVVLADEHIRIRALPLLPG